QGEFDVASEGKIVSEHPGTVVCEARRGLPPLILNRAADIASEKARDVGVGLVRVKDLAECGPAAPVVAQMALGPEIGVIFGPGASVALAIPSAEGLPALCDTALEPAAGSDRSPHAKLDPARFPWSVLATERDLVVLAVAVKSFEALGTFLERVGL